MDTTKIAELKGKFEFASMAWLEASAVDDDDNYVQPRAVRAAAAAAKAAAKAAYWEEMNGLLKSNLSQDEARRLQKFLIYTI